VLEPQAEFDQSGGLISPEEHIQAIEKEMKEAASRLEFERAAALRDEIKRLREKQLLLQ
jgi:excinuclease ABC subunit B